MEMWTTTWGLALGLPISFGLAGVVQLTRWRAAKLTQPIPDASEVDQDALKKEREAMNKAKFSKVKLAGMVVAFAAYMAFIVFMDRLPSAVKLGFWAVIGCIAITVHMTGMLTHVTGVVSSGVARHSNKDVQYRDHIPSWSAVIAVALFSLMIAGFTAASPFIAPGNETLVMGLFALLGATVPYRLIGNCRTISSKPSAPLKWRLFGLSAFVVGFLGLVTLVMAITSAFVLAFPGNESESEPESSKNKEDPAFLDAFMKIMLHTFFPLQFCTLFGSIGGVLMPLYRVDWILANKRSGVQLEDDSDVQLEREIFSESKVVGESDDQIDRKDLGRIIVVPSFAQLVARGQIGHFIAKPVYAGTALVTIQMTMLGCTWMGKRIVDALQPADTTNPIGGIGIAMLASFAALGLTPFIVTPVLAIVSGLKGDFDIVFNHRADWGQHASGQDESESLLEPEQHADEKSESVKRDVIDA